MHYARLLPPEVTAEEQVWPFPHKRIGQAWPGDPDAVHPRIFLEHYGVITQSNPGNLDVILHQVRISGA
jgi:hypothetical protein